MLDQERQFLFADSIAVDAEPSTPRTAERDLMLAVLEDAMRCVLNGRGASDPKKRALHEEAAAWFAEPEDTGLFSFASVCAVLGFDPDFVRRQLDARGTKRNTTMPSGGGS